MSLFTGVVGGLNWVVGWLTLQPVYSEGQPTVGDNILWGWCTNLKVFLLKEPYDIYCIWQTESLFCYHMCCYNVIYSSGYILQRCSHLWYVVAVHKVLQTQICVYNLITALLYKVHSQTIILDGNIIVYRLRHNCTEFPNNLITLYSILAIHSEL